MREGWKSGTLGDLVEESISEAVDRPHEYELLTVRLHAKGIVSSGKSPNQTAGGRKHYVRRPGEILVGRQNYHRRCVGRVPSSLTGFVTSNAISAFVAREGVDPDFALIAMQSVEAAESAEMFMSGTGQREISVKNLLSVPFRIPLLEEQRRIVDLIGSLDEAIEAAENSAKVIQVAYANMLGSLASRGYQQLRVGDVVSLAKAGGTPSRQVKSNFGGSIPWLKSGEVENDSISGAAEQITAQGLASSSAWLAPAGSIVVAMYGQGDTKGKVGFVSGPVAMNQAVLALVPDTRKIVGRLLFHIMKSRTESLRSKAVGAAQPNLSKGIVTDETIPVPPLEDQPRLVAAFDAVASLLGEAQSLREALLNTRSELLTVLLSGEHEIPESYDVDTAVQLEPAA